jgi:hypothetical protein
LPFSLPELPKSATDADCGHGNALHKAVQQHCRAVLISGGRQGGETVVDRGRLLLTSEQVWDGREAVRRTGAHEMSAAGVVSASGQVVQGMRIRVAKQVVQLVKAGDNVG